MESTKTRALLVGIDGVSWRHLLAADTPNIDRVKRAGALYPVQVDQANPTISAPVWSTVLTGVDRSQHGVQHNLSHDHQLYDYPNIFEQLESIDTSIETFAAVTWPTLATNKGCGPIIRQATYVPFPGLADDPDKWAESDEMVMDYSVRQIRKGAEFAFIYFGQADCVAHNRGTGKVYQDAIERCDRLVGSLLDFVLTENNAVLPGWSLVLVTDHGHIDGGGHGGDTPEERTAWIATAGLINESSDVCGELKQSDITPALVKLFRQRSSDGEPGAVSADLQ